MSSPILAGPKRPTASQQRKSYLLSGAGVFLRLVRGEGRGELLLEMGQIGGPAAVRMPYERLSPISCGRPWSIAENPRPEAKVKSVSVRSLSNNMTLTVVAITAALH